MTTDAMDFDKAKSFGGDRSAAARYAAQVRWGNRSKTSTSNQLPEYDSDGTEAMFAALYVDTKGKITYQTIDHKNNRMKTVTESTVYHGPWNQEEWSAMVGYQESAHRINQKLNGTFSGGQKVEEAIQGLDFAFRHAPRTTRTIMVGRGMRRHINVRGGSSTSESQKRIEFLAGLKVGEGFRAKNFISTSASKEAAEDFNTGGLFLNIVIPKGSRVISMRHALGIGSGFDKDYGHEKEILINRNSRFTVLKKTQGVRPNGKPTTILTVRLEND